MDSVTFWGILDKFRVPSFNYWTHSPSNPTKSQYSYDFEPRVLCYPFRYFLISDYSSNPMLIKPERIEDNGTNQFKVMVKTTAISSESKYNIYVENYKYDGWSFYIALCVLLNVLLKKKTLLQVLQKVKLFYNPVYKISESFYSGNTTDHNAWETNFVNLRNEINTVSPIVQGIIMIPPKLSKINNTKSNFPWETIDEYY